MSNVVTQFEQLDAHDRLTVIEMTLCHPFAGDLAREFLEAAPSCRISMDEAVLELIAWLVIARQAYGLQGVGRA